MKILHSDQPTRAGDIWLFAGDTGMGYANSSLTLNFTF